MKTTIAGMTAISGLIMAGAETPSLFNQFIVCAAGLAMFAAGLYWIAAIHRRL